jgi:hypothetical protein
MSMLVMNFQRGLTWLGKLAGLLEVLRMEKDKESEEIIRDDSYDNDDDYYDDDFDDEFDDDDEDLEDEPDESNP